MKRFFLAAVLLCAGAASPALAQSNHDAVQLSTGQDSDAHWSGFRGPVRGVSLMSPDNDVYCNAVTVHYLGDGASKLIFSGMLYRGEKETLSLPARRLSGIRLLCHADNADGATLDVSATLAGRMHRS